MSIERVDTMKARGPSVTETWLDMDKLIFRVAQVIIARGIPIDRAAREIGLARQNLDLLLREKTKPKFTTAVKMKKWLEIYEEEK